MFVMLFAVITACSSAAPVARLLPHCRKVKVVNMRQINSPACALDQGTHLRLELLPKHFSVSARCFSAGMQRCNFSFYLIMFMTMKLYIQ